MSLRLRLKDKHVDSVELFIWMLLAALWVFSSVLGAGCCTPPYCCGCLTSDKTITVNRDVLFWAVMCNNALTEVQSCFDSITVVIKSVNKRRNGTRIILRIQLNRFIRSDPYLAVSNFDQVM